MAAAIMWTLVRHGAITLALAVVIVVALVAIPAYAPSEPLASLDWFGRVAQVLTLVLRGELPEPSAVLRSTRLYADLPQLLFTSGKLVIGAMIGALLLALPAGISTALAPHDARRRAVARVLTAISSLPVIVWATMLLLLSLTLQVSLTTNATFAYWAALTTLVVGDRLVGDLTARIANATRELLDEPYLRTVRASGFDLVRHVAQGLVPPISDAVASRTLFLIGGAIVVERLFDIRGLGFRVFESLDSNPLERELIVVCAIGLVVLGLFVRSAAAWAAVLADGRRRG